MLGDAYKTAFSMYAKERDHTVMYIPFKCLFQVPTGHVRHSACVKYDTLKISAIITENLIVVIHFLAPPTCDGARHWSLRLHSDRP